MTNSAKYLILFICLLNIPNIYAKETAEARILWVTRWDFQNSTDVTKIIQNAAEHNFNVLFFQVRGNGTLYYQSQLEPFALKPHRWDPLQTAIDAAHQAGLELHAWFNVFPAWAGSTPPRDKSHLFHQHPDWFMQDRYQLFQPLKAGYIWLSPTHPGVQEHVIQLCQELFENYHIDGLHLDYIRFPGPGFSYDAETRKQFLKNYHTLPQYLPEQWNRYRRGAITKLVQKIYSLIQQKYPQITLSAAVTQHKHTRSNLYFQEPQRWLASHSIDMVCPMIYTTDNYLFETCVTRHLQEIPGPGIYPGIMVHEHHIIDQILFCRQSGIQGHCLFSYKKLFPQHRPNAIARLLKQTVYQQKVQPPQKSRSQPANHTSGSFIEKITTYPPLVPENQPFHVYCKINHEAGLNNPGNGTARDNLFLLWERADEFQQPHFLKMKRWNNSANVYCSEKQIPPQPATPHFIFQIFAGQSANQISPHKIRQSSHLLADAGKSFLANSTGRQLSYREHREIRIYPEDTQHAQPRFIGPPITKIKGLAVDAEGKIWVSGRSPGCVRIFRPNGNEAFFSPLKFGINSKGALVAMQAPTEIAIGPDGTVYVIDNSDRPAILRFHFRYGQALRGFEPGFKPGSIAIDNRHQLYVTHSWGNRFYILDKTGRKIGSNVHLAGSQFQDLAVTPDGRKLYVVGGKPGIIYKWERASRTGNFHFVNSDSIHWEGIGGIDIDDKGIIYVSQTYNGLILLLNEQEELLDILPRRQEPLAAPRFTATHPNSPFLYSVGLSAEGPIQILQWPICQHPRKNEKTGSGSEF